MMAPKLSNIPLHNLLQEFFLWQEAFEDPSFLAQFRGANTEGIQTPIMLWYGLPESLLTLVIQRVILGLESYLKGVVWLELGEHGRLTTEINDQIRDPFRISNGGAARAYFMDLPRLLDGLADDLPAYDSSLWVRIRDFYREVRNPIFHGKELDSADPAPVIESLALLADVYRWIERWHPLEMSGTNLPSLGFVVRK